MKVLAIGGSGGMGRATVRAALSYDFISEIVVAGIDRDIGERFVESLNDPRARSIYLDVTNEVSLRQAIRNADVVLNSAGPFFRFGVPVLSAAIDEGKHYSDICDDWQPTIEMLKLSERAKKKNVTAVIGLGASPGVVNLLCVKAATALDNVDTIVSAWKLSGAVNDDDGFVVPPEDGHVDAAAVHLIHCLSEKIRVLRNGKPLDTNALEHSQIDFPTLGLLDVWSLGHPEAVTLARRFPTLQNSYNGMLGIEDIVDSLRQISDAVATKQLSVEDAAQMLSADGGRESRHDKLAENDREEVPGALAFAAGRKNGRAASAGAFIKNSPKGGMASITGIPHALFLPLLHKGELQKTGVYAPEEIVNPDAFFELLDKFCGPDGAGLTVVTSD